MTKIILIFLISTTAFASNLTWDQINETHKLKHNEWLEFDIENYRDTGVRSYGMGLRHVSIVTKKTITDRGIILNLDLDHCMFNKAYSYELNLLEANNMSFESFKDILSEGSYNTSILQYVEEKNLSSSYAAFNSSLVGASGAIYGVLVAFAFSFPNSELMLLFPPIPIKAKFLVPGLIIIDLFFGLSSFSLGPIAHFAHVGGALTGLIMVWYWKKNQFNKNRWN